MMLREDTPYVHCIVVDINITCTMFMDSEGKMCNNWQLSIDITLTHDFIILKLGLCIWLVQTGEAPGRLKRQL